MKDCGKRIDELKKIESFPFALSLRLERKGEFRGGSRYRCSRATQVWDGVSIPEVPEGVYEKFAGVLGV